MQGINNTLIEDQRLTKKEILNLYDSEIAPYGYPSHQEFLLYQALLTQALALLKIADEKTQQCLEELGGVEETQIALSAELVALSNQQAEEDNSPVVSNVNGFTMGVEVDPKYKVGTLDRRRAVAKDSKGIVILRGEPSFSATDQILIDELAFYITTNNLKA